MIELDVVGVRVEVSTSSPMLLLRQSDGSRFLAIWIGAAEASAIVNALECAKPPRPLSHDLMSSLLELIDEPVEGVITDVEDGVFYGHLTVGDNEIEARPSDMIALALRSDFKFICLESVMDNAGVEVLEEAEDEVERFKEFLEHVTPEDFEG